MSCPSCGHENPAGARFCNDCGARLAAPATAPEPRSYTPRHLVEKILASKSALEGERKPVTVLFADVARSMELAERSEEHTSELQSPCNLVCRLLLEKKKKT